MNLKILLAFILISILSCKTSKERKACLKLTSENKSLEIETFDDLKEYTGANWVKLLGSIWILDGEIVAESEIENRINKKMFDILKVKVLDGDTIQFSCKKVPLYILISTNNCLQKH